METRYSPNHIGYQHLGTNELRTTFLVESLFAPGKLELIYSDADRAIIGSAAPVASPIKLTADAELRAAYFCERRELGVLNIGGPGVVTVDKQDFELAKCDGLYVGRGSQSIEFHSNDPANPAAFYLLSYPAHTAYPTTLIPRASANAVHLGSVADANLRTIHQYIHTGGVRSCQLVMGYTQLHEGSVWNTMPPHTHARRTEIYVYFDLGKARAMHFMGAPEETRHIVISDRQAVISPSWSIHCACGTGSYAFCWGMGGENQEFTDMDSVPLERLS
ncbi:MAG TPA: 5-dehydro-4-deoxy-D-glucuronate isomerase [Bryobacteraceae bacterium]|nr:5-dehydro-4-deoxy-D-glucuronate isomerase [Bryobacteraceae bacterium]